MGIGLSLGCGGADPADRLEIVVTAEVTQPVGSVGLVREGPSGWSALGDGFWPSQPLEVVVGIAECWCTAHRDMRKYINNSM